jgi:tetratricopeptide (TPR) repeat protein
MTVSISNELSQAKELLSENKFKESLEIVKKLEQNPKISPEDQIATLILKGKIYLQLRYIKELPKIGDIVYNLSKTLNNETGIVQSLIFKSYTPHLNEALKYGLDAKDYLNNHPEIPKIEGLILYSEILYRISNIYFFTSNLENALELAKESLAVSKELNNKLGLALATNWVGWTYLGIGNYDIALEYASEVLSFQSIATTDFELNTILHTGYFLSTATHIFKGEIGQAYDYAMKLLSVKTYNDFDKHNKFMILGSFFREKGELPQAIKYYKDAIRLAKDNEYSTRLFQDLTYIGLTYKMQGDYDEAIESLELGLEIAKDIGAISGQFLPYLYLIIIYLEINSNNRAQKYLLSLKDISDSDQKYYAFEQAYLLANALVLKSKGRARYRAEAENLLKQIVNSEIQHPQISILSLVSYCEFLLEELKDYEDPDILGELNPLITRLLRISETQHSYLYLANTKLLQAKLALIQLDFEGAKILFTQAQRIAEEHGLSLLSMKISIEHDELLDQLNMWERIREKNAPLSERVKLASFDSVIDDMQRKPTINPPKLSSETSVLLLIIAEGGTLLFSNAFTEEISFEEELVSGFLSAFNTFSGELFSKDLDRAKFGEYTILMEPVNSFSICYLFRGQTYSAKRKLTQFTEDLQNNNKIIQTLNRFHETSQVLELSDLPSLENLISEIFLLEKPDF